jgi:uncharacterized protein (TIGR02231 family)
MASNNRSDNDNNNPTDSNGIEQDSLPLDGNNISAVTVFSDRALVTRQVSATAKAGMNRFVVPTQAFSVDAESAQARVFGRGEILGVQYISEPVIHHTQERVNDLEQQKRQMKRDRKNLQGDREATLKQKQFLDSVIQFAEVQVPREIKTEFPAQERLKETLSFLNTNFTSLNQTENDLDKQIEELDEHIAVIEKQLKQVSHGQSAYLNSIEVLFEAEEEQAIDMEVSYGVSNAQWHPVYKVDVPLDLKYVNLTMLARIQQQSGELWEDVELSLSNALPLTSGELPDLNSWYLHMPRPPKPYPKMLRARKTKMDEMEVELADVAEEDMLAAAAAAPVPEAQFAQAVQTELPTAFEYHYSRPVRIDSSDKQALVPLFSKQIDGEFYYYVVPQADPLVYLVCNAKADQSLIEGRLNVHFGGRYIGGTFLSEKKPGEDMLLNLGAERGIKVSRQKVTDSVTETFFGKVDRSSVAREIAFRLVVENLKDSPETLQLVDSIPVSKTDRFQVKGVDIHPKPTETDWKKREGVMLWKLDLEPQSVTEIAIKFFVKHPKDQPPEGLY